MEICRTIRLNRTTFVILIVALITLLFVYLMLGGGGLYNNNDVKISKLLAASIHLAEEAGKAVVEVRKSKDLQNSKMKEGPAGREIVTIGDQKSHNIITRGMNKVWPKLRTKSEEKTLASDDNEPIINPILLHPQLTKKIKKRDEKVNIEDITIWIDPLDATQEFTEGGSNPQLLEYVTVMICIVVKDEPIASVIHQPFVEGPNGMQGVTYWAWLEHGVSPNLGQSLAPPPSDTLRVITSRSHNGNAKKTADEALGNIKIKHMTAAGSGYKTLQVALRKADLYFHTTVIKKWDTCAGDALISGVQGVMTTRRGRYITYDPDMPSTISDGLIVANSQDAHSRYFYKLRKF